MILLCTAAIHIDKTIWGEDAEIFRPERWEKADVHPYAFHPYSFGPRSCIGREFNNIETQICIVKLIQAFTFRVPSRALPPHKGSVVFRSDQELHGFTVRYNMDMEWDPKAIFA